MAAYMKFLFFVALAVTTVLAADQPSESVRDKKSPFGLGYGYGGYGYGAYGYGYPAVTAYAAPAITAYAAPVAYSGYPYRAAYGGLYGGYGYGAYPYGASFLFKK